MSLKIALAALALTLLPALAMAQCGHGQQASMSCADGMVFDAETQGCVPVAS